MPTDDSRENCLRSRGYEWGHFIISCSVDITERLIQVHDGDAARRFAYLIDCYNRSSDPLLSPRLIILIVFDVYAV